MAKTYVLSGESKIEINNYSGDFYENSRYYTSREWDSPCETPYNGTSKARVSQGKETGLYFYRARYYSPELGRFVSRDPIDTADQINLYTYVKNNPMRYVDPSGMWSLGDKAYAPDFQGDNEGLGKPIKQNKLSCKVLVIDMSGDPKYYPDILIKRISDKYSGTLYSLVSNKDELKLIIGRYSKYNIKEIVIVGHGTSYTIDFGNNSNGDNIHMDNLNKESENPLSGLQNYKYLKKITLASCNTGNEKDSLVKDQNGETRTFAGDLAKVTNTNGHNKIEVVAPNKYYIPSLDIVLGGNEYLTNYFSRGDMVSFPSKNVEQGHGIFN